MDATISGSDIKETAIDLIEDDRDAVVPIDLRVNNLNYTITDRPGSWWQKITNLQVYFTVLWRVLF